jgi:hypothetical protein
MATKISKDPVIPSLLFLFLYILKPFFTVPFGSSDDPSQVAPTPTAGNGIEMEIVLDKILPAEKGFVCKLHYL